MKIYDDVENVWSPYLMLKQKNLIKNEVLNTDKFGFRYTESFEKFTILDDIKNNKDEEQIAVIGNSTAFGIGASSDKKTIPSYLTNFSYEVLKDFNQDEYFKTDDYFKRVCKKNNISYLDLNKVLKSHDTKNNWLFVDALHLTDLGYKIVSEEINFLIK